MYPHSFKEYLGSGLCYASILAGEQNSHFRKMINHHKKTVISSLG
jgi:hypothetical protein